MDIGASVEVRALQISDEEFPCPAFHGVVYAKMMSQPAMVLWKGLVETEKKRKVPLHEVIEREATASAKTRRVAQRMAPCSGSQSVSQSDTAIGVAEAVSVEMSQESRAVRDEFEEVVNTESEDDVEPGGLDEVEQGIADVFLGALEMVDETVAQRPFEEQQESSGQEEDDREYLADNVALGDVVGERGVAANEEVDPFAGRARKSS